MHRPFGKAVRTRAFKYSCFRNTVGEVRSLGAIRCALQRGGIIFAQNEWRFEPAKRLLYLKGRKKK